MATDKKKKEVKVRDLKPSTDAKGGARSTTSAHRNSALGGKTDNASGRSGIGARLN